MNSFFASCEQQANPMLRGKPVGICAYLHPKGCVIAASIEAKQRGVKVGMTIEQIKEIAPDTVFIENDPPKYRAITSKFFSLLHDYTDTVEYYSIDEAFLDLTGWCRDEAEAAYIISRIKYRLKTEIGEWFRCSAGISYTKFLAKFASDRQKPDGLVIITPDLISNVFVGIPVDEASGIGRRMKKRLQELKITTLDELRRYPAENLIRVFGKQGYYLSAHVNGIECDQITNERPLPKSVGHSYCVPNNLNREGKVSAVFTKLAERAGRRMRAYGLYAGGVVATVGHREGEYRSIHKTFQEPLEDAFQLIQRAEACFQEAWQNQPVDFLAVAFFHLQPPSNQLMFKPYAEAMQEKEQARGTEHAKYRPERYKAVSISLDKIKNRHGDQSIVFGRMFALLEQDEAPDRIGFRKVENLEIQKRE